jgi:hypothetical protein
MPKLFTSIQGVSIVRAGGTSLPLLSMPETANTATNIEQTATIYNPGQLCDTTDASSRSKTSVQTYIKIETKPLSRACPRRCPCQCHIPLKATTPRWLQGLVGTAFVNFTGTPLLNHRSCDFKKCDKGTHGSGSVRFSYLFPAWLLRTGIDFTASWRDVSGIGGSWSLKMPRMIDDALLYNRLSAAVENSSTTDVRHLMTTHGVRAFDEFPSFLINSVLTVSIIRDFGYSQSD